MSSARQARVGQAGVAWMRPTPMVVMTMMLPTGLSTRRLVACAVPHSRNTARSAKRAMELERNAMIDVGELQRRADGRQVDHVFQARAFGQQPIAARLPCVVLNV